MIRHWLGNIAIFGACVCITRTVTAEVSVLVITPTDDAIDYSLYENRLRSELLAAGFSVSADRVPGRPDYASIASNAERSASQAALAINISDGELCGLLWIGDPSKSGGLMRPVRCCPLNDEAPAVFAVRATDALSAGLLELHYPKRTPEAPKPSTGQEPAHSEQPAKPAAEPAHRVEVEPDPKPKLADSKLPRTPTPHAWHIQAAAAAGAWLREFPVGFGGKLEATRELTESVSAGIQGVVLAPSSVSRRTGQANIAQFLAGPTLQYRTRLTPGLSIIDALGAGLYGISVDATATGPYASRDAFGVTGYVLFEHQVQIEVTDSLSFVLSGALSAPWMQYSVVIDNATAARAAAPLVLVNLGVDLRL